MGGALGGVMNVEGKHIVDLASKEPKGGIYAVLMEMHKCGDPIPSAPHQATPQVKSSQPPFSS